MPIFASYFFYLFQILLNCGYCCLFLAGKIIQKLVFGELRVSESQHLKDKLWNFVFYKFIFVFGVINVQYMDEVLLWCAWFNVLGSFHLLAQLCKDRFEYLSFSAANSPWSYMPLVTLLGLLMILSFGMLTISVFVGLKWGFSSFAFMGAETLLRYILHLYEVRGDMTGRIWEKRSSLAYYTELSLELTALIIELAHHLHMLLWSNIFLSMASLVICMHIRFLVEEIRRRVRKHRNYLWVLYHMEQSYPMASLEELSEISDNCAICWEKMEAARKLPCSHLFHNGCLQSWLEQDTSCPTCRMALSINNRDANMIFSVDHHHLRTRTNHIFHFDGNIYY
ncbi:hypothetical protein AAG570_012871 [Ranatra chinensis]|uniref:RING-type domain-containing protein n=1 Tax=Ranatra chinensis TaxID=642074 RepID=A0ABD0YRJ1_9HEMI